MITNGLIGKKLGMTQMFDKDGNVVPITIVETGPCTVLELKDEAAKIKLGYGSQKESRVNKAELGFFKKIGVSPVRVIKEFDLVEGEFPAEPVAAEEKKNEEGGEETKTEEG